MEQQAFLLAEKVNSDGRTVSSFQSNLKSALQYVGSALSYRIVDSDTDVVIQEQNAENLFKGRYSAKQLVETADQQQVAKRNFF
jgi:hypothetical protein